MKYCYYLTSLALMALSGVGMVSCSGSSANKNVSSDSAAADSASAGKEVAVEYPEDALAGDFDGDGKVDHVWIDGRYDSEGYAETQLTLKSDNPALEGLHWRDGIRGVDIQNLGDLNDSGRDFLGCVPYGDSDWCTFETYGHKDGAWKSVIPDFSIWIGNDNYDRVSKSKLPGYVTVTENDITDSDRGSDNVIREMKMIW